MKEETKTEGDFRPIKLFGMLLPSIPGLTIRLATNLLRFKKDAQKAGKTFKKELRKQGIDKETANELTEVYLQSSHIRQYIQGLR